PCPGDGRQPMLASDAATIGMSRMAIKKPTHMMAKAKVFLPGDNSAGAAEGSWAAGPEAVGAGPAWAGPAWAGPLGAEAEAGWAATAEVEAARACVPFAGEPSSDVRVNAAMGGVWGESLSLRRQPRHPRARPTRRVYQLWPVYQSRPAHHRWRAYQPSR